MSEASVKQPSKLPNPFVFLNDIDPTIISSVRYNSDFNFLGRKVTGYNCDKIICTYQAAQCLKQVQDELKSHGYELVVYDGYRPQRAVQEFANWSADLNDQINKSYYYPTINKQDVFKLGYVVERSGHSRGSTFDLTIIEQGSVPKPIKYIKRTLLNGDEIFFLDDQTVDMGSSFDLFHTVSEHNSILVDPACVIKRNFLRNIMLLYGFKDYATEWWHYTLVNEPYPETYFDFVIE